MMEKVITQLTLPMNTEKLYWLKFKKFKNLKKIKLNLILLTKIIYIIK